jgi:hypothetical protein
LTGEQQEEQLSGTFANPARPNDRQMSVEVLGASLGSGSPKVDLEIVCLPLPPIIGGPVFTFALLWVVSSLPAQSSRYLFLQAPWLPSLTSLGEWRPCIDHRL